MLNVKYELRMHFKLCFIYYELCEHEVFIVDFLTSNVKYVTN